MKILFTGASSFTGYWFVKELTDLGHEVYTTYTKKDIRKYTGLRLERILKLSSIAKQIFDCRFGSENFLKTIKRNSKWDLFCHHGAYVVDYKSSSFNIYSSVENNTFNILPVLELLKNNGCVNIILTGSVFENDEGEGNGEYEAFSPYGLSKGITFQIYRYYTQLKKMKLGKFTIPNPFGPYEEPRFTDYLIKTWMQGEIASVKTPEYIRDNIHVTLLARSYSYFITKFINSNENLSKFNPSQYTETQSKFAERFAKAMQKRIGVICSLEMQEQCNFFEPMLRINKDKVQEIITDWDENISWDQLAAYYKNKYNFK